MLKLHWRGIEPRSPAWQARILPLNHQCYVLRQLWSVKITRQQSFCLSSMNLIWRTTATLNLDRLKIVHHGILLFLFPIYWCLLVLKYSNHFLCRLINYWTHEMVLSHPHSISNQYLHMIRMETTQIRPFFVNAKMLSHLTHDSFF